MHPRLSVSLGKLTLQNPIMTASGTFGYGREFVQFIDLNRLGGIITKSVTQDQRPGNPPHRIVEVPGGMLNSIGLANVGVEKFVEEKIPFLKTLRCKRIVNIAGESLEEYTAVMDKLEMAGEGIDGYEINLSCPNVKEGGRTFGKDPGQVLRITTELRRMTKKPLIIKLTPECSDIGELGRAAEEGGADIVSAINTFVGLAIDVKKRRPILGKQFGGFSGPGLRALAVAKVFELREAISIPIIGIGGIFSLDDVLEFLLAGASAVQIGTANYIEPDISERLVDQLDHYCEKEGFNSISELIGVAHS